MNQHLKIKRRQFKFNRLRVTQLFIIDRFELRLQKIYKNKKCIKIALSYEEQNRRLSK